MNPLVDSRRTQVLAWAASLAVHAALSTSVLLVAGRQGGQQLDEGVVREVGIIVRNDAPEPIPFEESPEPVDEPIPPTENPVPAPPTLTKQSPFSGLLEDLVSEALAPTDEREGPAPEAIGEGKNAKRAAWADLPLGHTRVKVFGVEGVGSRFVYAFDRSISMSGAPLMSAKSQLIQSLDGLDSTHQFQAIFFSTSIAAYDLTGGQRRLAFATDQNKRRAIGFVQGVTAHGGTDRYQALRQALNYRPDAVFFLTDADGGMDPIEFERVVNAAVNGGVSINSIEFGQGPSRGVPNFLVRLAQATGGNYGYVDTRRLRR